jgi:hypothetical protein
MQSQNSVNGSERQTDRNAVNWRRTNQIVRNLRQRIFRASQEGDFKKASGMFLLKFGWFKIERHVMVKGYNSPDDGTLRNYWDWRNRKKAKDLKPSRILLAQSQKGRCVHCGKSLFEDEDIELHHKVSRGAGGTDKYKNLELLLLFCHQQIHQTGMQGFVCKCRVRRNAQARF